MKLSFSSVACQTNTINYQGKHGKKIVELAKQKCTPESISIETDKFLKKSNKEKRTLVKKYEDMFNKLKVQRQGFMDKFRDADQMTEQAEIMFDNSKCHHINGDYTNLSFMSSLNNAIIKLKQALEK